MIARPPPDHGRPAVPLRWTWRTEKPSGAMSRLMQLSVSVHIHVSAVADPGHQVRGFIYFIFRVARCPVFSRTVRYFGPLFGIRMIVIRTMHVSIVQYFVQPSLTLLMSDIFERATWQPYSHFQWQLPATLTNHRLKVSSGKQQLYSTTNFPLFAGII